MHLLVSSSHPIHLKNTLTKELHSCLCVEKQEAHWATSLSRWVICMKLLSSPRLVTPSGSANTGSMRGSSAEPGILSYCLWIVPHHAVRTRGCYLLLLHNKEHAEWWGKEELWVSQVATTTHVRQAQFNLGERRKTSIHPQTKLTPTWCIISFCRVTGDFFFIFWGGGGVTAFFQFSILLVTPCFFPSLSVRLCLITSLLDTDMGKFLSMLGEIIDFCSVRATIKTEDHSVLRTCAVYKIMSKSAHGLT